MNIHNSKFELKKKENSLVTDYISKTPPSISDGRMSKFNSPKNKKMFIRFAQKGEAHVQRMNNQYAKFEY